MTKKRRTKVPDFSTRRPPRPASTDALKKDGSAAPRPAQAPAVAGRIVKPHATSMKSGRRGS